MSHVCSYKEQLSLIKLNIDSTNVYYTLVMLGKVQHLFLPHEVATLGVDLLLLTSDDLGAYHNNWNERPICELR